MERLVAGRERIYLDRFWNEFSATPSRFSEASREHYAKLYALPGAMHSGFMQFAAFDQDALEAEVPEQRVLEYFFPGAPIGIAQPTMLPMSWVTRSERAMPNWSSTPAMSAACVFLSNPPAGFAERPIRRKSGATTVWSREVNRHCRPHIAGLAITVQQQDRRSGAAAADMERGAVGHYVARRELLGKLK